MTADLLKDGKLGLGHSAQAFHRPKLQSNYGA